MEIKENGFHVHSNAPHLLCFRVIQMKELKMMSQFNVCFKVPSNVFSLFPFRSFFEQTLIIVFPEDV